MTVITGIGSRYAPSNILKEAIKIGEYCRTNKIWIRSGHADGMDWAFEQGSQEYCLVYLPWQGFNKHLSSSAKSIVVSPEQNYMDIVKEIHPAYDKLTRGALALHCRNTCQVLGLNLDSPSSAVIAWTPNGEFIGGTATALRIAQNYDIPIYNMALEEYNSAEKIIELLS